MQSLVGRELGPSDWFVIDQQRIDRFAAVTEDPDPMHIDPQWCERHSPYGGTIAFGFLTLSMLTYFNRQIVTAVDPTQLGRGGYAINYGFNRVRFVAPVAVNSRIRCRMKLLECTEHGPGQQLHKFAVTVEIEHQARPALVAEWLGLWVASDVHRHIQPVASAAS